MFDTRHIIPNEMIRWDYYIGNNTKSAWKEKKI